MIKSACNLMKQVIVLSVTLIVGGGLLVLMGQLLSLGTMVPIVFTYLGLFSIFAGVLILIATTIVIMVPKVSRQLDPCQH